MTTNQIAYQSLLEQTRSNRAREEETSRSNRAQELETNRSNLARELETYRSNLTKEAETSRHNRATEEDTDKARTQMGWKIGLDTASKWLDTAAKTTVDLLKGGSKSSGYSIADIAKYI